MQLPKLLESEHESDQPTRTEKDKSKSVDIWPAELSSGPLKLTGHKKTSVIRSSVKVLNSPKPEVKTKM
jgi:hypothetical protein